jgi:hypothetical protein
VVYQLLEQVVQENFLSIGAKNKSKTTLNCFFLTTKKRKSRSFCCGSYQLCSKPFVTNWFSSS